MMSVKISVIIKLLISIGKGNVFWLPFVRRRYKQTIRLPSEGCSLKVPLQAVQVGCSG